MFTISSTLRPEGIRYNYSEKFTLLKFVLNLGVHYTKMLLVVGSVIASEVLQCSKLREFTFCPDGYEISLANYICIFFSVTNFRSQLTFRNSVKVLHCQL